MKKLFSFVLSAMMLMLASCTQDDLSNLPLGQEMNTKVSMQLPTMQRAGHADPNVNGMRVLLIVSHEDEVVDVQTATATSNTVNFDVRLVTGQSYDLAAWADFGEEYYTVNAAIGAAAPSVSMVTPENGVVVGSNNKRDAYFAISNGVVLRNNEPISMTLKRPFGLVKIVTNDYNEEAVKNADLYPDSYTTTIEMPTTLSLVDGAASNNQAVTIAASTADVAASGELSFDYIFASTNKELIDFTMDYKKGTADLLSYEFKDIPLQRNYKTNISGNILTKQGTVTVTIEQIWDTPAYTVDLMDVAANGLQDALDAIGSEATPNRHVTINLTDDLPAGGIYTLPAMDEQSTLTINMQKVTENGIVTFKGETFNGTIKLTNTADETNKVNVTVLVPEGDATIGAGSWGIVTGETRQTTLRIEGGANVETIHVEAGNVNIYEGATVTTVTADQPTTVYVEEGVTAPTASGNVTIEEGVKLGNIINVTTGKDYATIALALTAANPYDVIELAEGEYNMLDEDGTGIKASDNQYYYFPIEVEGLTIRSKGDRNRTIIYSTKETPNTTINNQNFITVKAKNVTLEGLTIMPKNTINKTIEITADGFTLRNCKITPNTYIDAIANERAGSVYFTYPTYGYTVGSINATIENCEFIKGNVCFDHMYAGTFNIKNNVFDNQNEDYPLFTTSAWMPANNFGQAEKDALFNSKMVVNITNNTFNNVQEYTGANYPVIRCAHGMFNLNGNTFPTNGIYWKAMKGSGTQGVAEYVNFGYVYVNYKSNLEQAWRKDRTNPLSFAVSNDFIEFETLPEPNNNWYSWQGRKTDVNINAKSAWTAEATLTIPEATRPVRQSIWLNVYDAAGNAIDWAIVGYKVESDGAAGYFETWDAHYVDPETQENTGLWSKVNISELNLNPGDKATVKFSMSGETMTVFINGIQVYSYVIEGTTASRPAEVILNSYSYGESYKTTWTYPVVK